MGASAVRARAIICAVVKASYYGRERARTAESTACPAFHKELLLAILQQRVFRRFASRSTLGAAPAAPFPRSLQKFKVVVARQKYKGNLNSLSFAVYVRELNAR